MQVFIGVVAVFVILIGLLWIVVPAFYGLPPVSTSRERIRRGLELADPQAGETLYDLGSGHGRVLVMAAREFGLNAVGIEAGPVQCAVSWVNAICNGVSSKVRIEAGNFYKSDLSNANIVFTYLTSDHGNRLEEKLKRELKPGARVITISFNLPNWEPDYRDREKLIFKYKKPRPR